MSIWTYANIKFTVRTPMTVSQIEEYFGFIESCEHFSAFSRNYNAKENKFLPSGSEGSLDILVNKTTKNKTVFTVCGGLRDVYSTKNISEWFNRIIKKDKVISDIIIKAVGYAQSIDEKPTLFNYVQPIKKKIFFLIKNIKWSIQNQFNTIFKK